jgi:hypothetical protein
MEQILFQDKYPIFSVQIDKSRTTFKSAQELTNYFKQLVDEHKVCRFIAEFDHYSHTVGLEGGEVAEDIIDARDIVFCFGTKIPNPEVLAVRPRSLGIAETANSFIISFMEAPMALANDTMRSWIESITDEKAAA